MNVFGMGAWEITIILVAALVIFGPNRLPEIAGKVGKSVRDLRQMSTDLTSEFERTAGVKELKQAVQGELTGIKSQVNSVSDSVKRDLNTGGKSGSSSVTSSKSSTTAKSSTSTSSVTGAKSATSSSTSAKTTGTKAAAPAAPPKATKKDPLADLGFFEDAPAASAASKTLPASAANVSTPAAAAAAVNDLSGAGDGLDALTRARQRRQAAGYNRRPA